jgi:hypothetical protein
VQDVPRRAQPIVHDAAARDFPAAFARVLRALNVAPALLALARNGVRVSLSLAGCVCAVLTPRTCVVLAARRAPDGADRGAPREVGLCARARRARAVARGEARGLAEGASVGRASAVRCGLTVLWPGTAGDPDGAPRPDEGAARPRTADAPERGARARVPGASLPLSRPLLCCTPARTTLTTASGQGSSIGTYTTQWCNEFYASARGESAERWLDEGRARRAKRPYPPLQILFPSRRTVQESVLGEQVCPFFPLFLWFLVLLRV